MRCVDDFVQTARSASSRPIAWLRAGVLAGALGTATFAHANVECVVNPQRYFVGDEGSLWVVWKEGGAGVIGHTDPDFKPTLAAVMAALLAARPMTVRYADGNSCTGSPAPIIGIWMQ